MIHRTKNWFTRLTGFPLWPIEWADSLVVPAVVIAATWGLLFAILAFACGCASYSTTFVDADGTTHTTNMKSFLVKLPVDDAGLDYKGEADGSFHIVEGRLVQDMDQTEVAKLGEALAAAAAAFGGIP